MWSVKVFKTNQNGRTNINIRYIEDDEGRTHLVVLRDLMAVLGYAQSSMDSGLSYIIKPIPPQFRKVECTDYLNPDHCLTPLVLLDYSGCYWFLHKTKMGNPTYLQKWLEDNIFTEEEINNLTIIEDTKKPDLRKRENHNNATMWTFDTHLIRVMKIKETLYFYAVDISKIFGEINHRHIIAKYIDPTYSSTIYHGQRPTTLLTIEGVVQLLNHIKDKTKANLLKDWLVNTAIPQYLEENKVEAFTDPNKTDDLRQDQQAGTSMPQSVPHVDIEFEVCQSAIQELTYPNTSSNKDSIDNLQVITEGGRIYFTIKSISTLLDIPTQEVVKMTPSIWQQSVLVVQVTKYTDHEGKERTQTAKQGYNCIDDSGLCALLEKLQDDPFKQWIITEVFPKLIKEGYEPSAPYDLDTTGLTEKDMKKEIDIYDKPRTINVQDLASQRFVCTFNDEDIPILVNKQGIWFALSAIEKALEYPLYLTKSNPLKVIDFSVVNVVSVQKIDLTSIRTNAKWVPYCIEYEGLKNFLAGCSKPNAEAFYLYLEETIIPYIRETLYTYKNTVSQDVAIKEEETCTTDNKGGTTMNIKEEGKKVQPIGAQTPVLEDTDVKSEDVASNPTTEEEPTTSADINVEKLLSDPDTFIRMLKAYKAVKDSKDDLSAENEALQEYIRANKSKIDFADTLTCDVDSEATKKFIKQLAENIIESGSQRLKEWLRDSVQNKKDTI